MHRISRTLAGVMKWRWCSCKLGADHDDTWRLLTPRSEFVG